MSDVKSNCLVFAFGHWFRYGGYLLVRKSHHWPGPHFAWSKDLKEFKDFTPEPDAHELMVQCVREHRLPPFWFRGHVKVSTEAP